MTPNAQRNLTFPWPIGDRALAAHLGRTLIPVLFGPFSRHQFCNRASRERPREGARFGLSGEAVEVGALRARWATCSRSSGRRWAMQSGRDGSRPTRTDPVHGPEPVRGPPPEMQAWTAPSSAGSSAGPRPGSAPRHGRAAARGHRDRCTGTARGLIRGAKHPAGTTRALEASSVRHLGLLTCRNTRVAVSERRVGT
jgi:hypothetical protein